MTEFEIFAAGIQQWFDDNETRRPTVESGRMLFGMALAESEQCPKYRASMLALFRQPHTVETRHVMGKWQDSFDAAYNEREGVPALPYPCASAVHAIDAAIFAVRRQLDGGQSPDTDSADYWLPIWRERWRVAEEARASGAA